MLIPKKNKFRKQFKGRIHGAATRGTFVSFGEYGLKCLGTERITSRQIEASRRALTRYMKRAGKVWIRIFPDVPVTAKPAEVRMGSGKGSVDRYVYRAQPGRVLFEVGGVSEEIAREAFRLASGKLPVATSFVRREDRGG